MIRLYGIESTSHKLPKILVWGTFFLEYVSQMIEIDNIHFLQSKKKGRTEYPVSMGVYAINNKRGFTKVIQIIKYLALPLESHGNMTHISLLVKKRRE